MPLPAPSSYKMGGTEVFDWQLLALILEPLSIEMLSSIRFLVFAEADISDMSAQEFPGSTCIELT